MDEQFYQSTRLDSSQLKKLVPRSNQQSLPRWCLQYAVLIGSASTLILAPEVHLAWYWILLASLCFAAMTMAMFAVCHESLHETAFASKSLNRLILTLSSFPIYYTPTGFREFHFTHHRYSHDSNHDPEISVNGQPGPEITGNLITYLVYITGMLLLMYKISLLIFASIAYPKWIWSKFLTYVPVKARASLILEARLILAFHVACALIGYLYLPGIFLVFAAQILGHSLLSLCLIAEHHGLEHQGLITERTRTTLTHPLILWIMWNMPYHTEHHAYPAIPWHALPRAFELLADERLHTQKGYLAFHGRVLKTLLKGQAFREATQHTGD